MTTEQLQKLPKTELHCHLDGSLSREFFEKRLGRPVEETELRVEKDCQNLAEYLAGAEAQYPMSEFVELFGKVKKLGMPFTIHAGECGNAENIALAVKAGAARIGHGIAMQGRDDVQELVKKAGVGVEMCLTSNLQTRAVSDAAVWPFREFLDKGLLVTLNTDNRTISGTSLTQELEFVQKRYGARDEEIVQCMKNAVRVSFADEKLKEKLYAQFT